MVTVGGQIYFGLKTVEDALNEALSNGTLTPDLINEICRNIDSNTVTVTGTVVSHVITAEKLGVDDKVFFDNAPKIADAIEAHVNSSINMLANKHGHVLIVFDDPDDE